MKKLLLLALPILLASCNFSSNPTNQNNGTQTQDSGNSTLDNTNQDNTGTQDEKEDGSEETTSGESGEHQHQHISHNTDNEKDDEKDDEEEEEDIKSTTISKAIADLGFESAKDVTAFDLTNDLHVECSKGTNKQNAPKYYATDVTLRLYGGNTLTFTSTHSITSIKLQITSDSGDNGISVSTGTISGDRKTWTGSAKSVIFTILEKSGKICITSISVTYGGTNESTDGGNSETGGGSSTEQEHKPNEGQSGPNIQAGDGNTSSEYTVAWTGVQYDIVYSMFKGNLPCLKAFNGYYTGDVDGSTIPYFNPYIKGWSKESQTYYDSALKDMKYVLIDSETISGDDVIKYYRRGTYYVQTEHYKGDDGNYYFDVYAYNDYQAPFELSYTPTVDLTTDVYNPKSGYKQFSKTINGITFNCSNVTKDNNCIQLNKKSTMEITGKTFSKMDLTFMKNANSCLVYAGSSSSTAKILYNDGGHFELPSGTKYIKIQTLNEACAIECLSIL